MYECKLHRWVNRVPVSEATRLNHCTRYEADCDLRELSNFQDIQGTEIVLVLELTRQLLNLKKIC